jgi:hypothetical protein
MSPIFYTQQLLGLVGQLHMGPLGRSDEVREVLLPLRLCVEGVLVAGIRSLERVVEHAQQVVVLVPCPRRLLARIYTTSSSRYFAYMNYPRRGHDKRLMVRIRY